MKVGLRIDVDTHVGLLEGVPRLLDILKRNEAHATFYVTMGPDRSGRAVLGALFRPGFLGKMLRTRAVATYGLRTVFSGTLLPARPVGCGHPQLLRAIVDSSQELGSHAWDHRRWQDRLDRMKPAEVAADLDRAFSALGGIPGAIGAIGATRAAPAWLSSESSLFHEETMNLAFASDCRGRSPFFPQITDRRCRLLQVPTTLPTLDEALGATCQSAQEFFGQIATEIDAAADRAEAFAVLTVHAGIEGRGSAADFERFLSDSRGKHVWTSLGELADEWRGKAPCCEMIRAEIPGRHGVVSMQGATLTTNTGDSK